MKRTTLIISVLSAVLFNCLLGGILSSLVGLAPAVGAIALNVLSFLLGSFLPEGALNATVFTEVWTREIIKQFTHAEDATFLNGVPDYSRYAENDVIHLVEAGVNPDVLVNNSTYPIPLQDLQDADKPISLDKYDTKTTPITDDELYALSYDKIALVKEKHANAIAETKHDKSIHAFAPAGDGATTPVIVTTGELVDNRRRLTTSDIISLKKRFDVAKVPASGRRLVLCSDHIEDLLRQDQKFAQQFYNYTSGKIANLYGFEVYEYVNCPLYTTAGVKKSFGAVASTGEYQASVAFVVGEMFKCSGSTKMYWSPAENDTDYHRNKVNFGHRFICLPKTNRAIGAIVSAYVAPVTEG